MLQNFVLDSTKVLGQNVVKPISKSKKAIKYYIAGQEALKNRNPTLAISCFNDAIKKDTLLAEAYLQLGLALNNYQRKPLQAETYLLKAEKINQQILDQSTQKLLALIAFSTGRYQVCIDRIIKIKTLNPTNIEDILRIEKNCYFALKAIENPEDILIEKLPENINQMDMQYFPVLTADQSQIVFTARNHKENNEDIYIADLISENKWTDPVSISDNINSPNQNEGTCTISADGRILVFTKCGGDNIRDTDCDLYISYKEGDNWSRPQSLGSKVNSSSWDSQPSLSGDGKTLYFSSRRKGGYGLEDIYMCQADRNGIWGDAINMGDIINTKGREVSPFIHPSQTTFYFSSDYHTGMGSFDLFISYFKNSNWSQPKNMGYPINSYLDESALFITADGKTAYYSSEDKRDFTAKSTKYNLFKYDLPLSLSAKQSSTYAKGRVFDAVTKLPIGSEVELIDLQQPNHINYVNADPKNGNYLVVLSDGSDYALYVNKPGYLFKSLYFSFLTDRTFNPVILDIYLEPIRKGASITLNNIFFKTGHYELETKSKVELDKLVSFLKLNADLKIEVSGHSDNVGNIKFNQVLSTSRAKTVFDYLITNDIDPTRIFYKGYGNTKPVASNETEETRKLNRRIEIKVL